MDIFRLRSRVVGDYSAYIGSFLKILDPRIDKFVTDKLTEGVLWPDPLLQLSPAFQPTQTVEDLVNAAVLHPLCASLFRSNGKSLLLHQHQRTALDVASRGHNYVVTTGTGSGKSLTYILPIFDHILKHKPELGQVRAIIVYPMNALINSQKNALDNFVNILGGPEMCPVRYARYTGQESDSEKRELQNNPPHILLTNYVMLELMLTRPEERKFVEATSANLQFLVLDELHTYRGRQGADVALLVRRLRERCGNPDLQCIGTSATMSTGNTRNERVAAIAEVTTKLFGAVVDPSNIIDETLRRTLSRSNSAQSANDAEALRKILESPEVIPSILDWDKLKENPLAVWIEENFGLDSDADGRLQRRNPITLEEGARRLEKLTGIGWRECAKQLQLIFNAGSKVRSPENISGFAFKLHQFFSQGGSVYATLENPDLRYLTLEGQHYAPGSNTADPKLLYPLVFCRVCGQEHYLCTYNKVYNSLTPRPPFSRDEPDDREVLDGYFLLDVDDIWSGDPLDLLPENWIKQLKSGPVLKSEYKEFEPRKLWVKPDGELTQQGMGPDMLAGWFIPTPFLTCLRCGEVYTKRQTSDFSKLSRLSSEGRSTATTLLSLSAITQMRNDNLLKEEARKLLSFTDNRQDASLQAGHFNDFVEVGLLRAAIYRALAHSGEGLNHSQIAAATVDELKLPESDYAREVSPVSVGPLPRRNRAALQALVEYRIYEDLRRGWRVTQPNLEQCGLLVIDYDGLQEVCESTEIWKNHPLLAQTAPAIRVNIIRTLLDHMRRELAISTQCLERSQQDALKKRVRETLKDPWAFDENEILYSARCFVQPGVPVAKGDNERSLGLHTALGKYLKSRETWPSLTNNLDQQEYVEVITELIGLLRGTGYLVEVAGQEGPAVQLRSDALVWRAGDGLALGRDLIRTRRLRKAYDRAATPNNFFAKFYRDEAARLQSIEGREHTGQVNQKDREVRESRFRQGNLSALFCSPTMELGIDIADLNMVHLRNVPPTPANYAQRSGRAGRSGQPALVATYCSVGSGHDQYFFRQPQLMVAGVVAPPRLDLGNEDLVRAHIHAVWLGFVGLKLGRSMIEVIDTADPANNYPLRHEVKLELENAGLHQQAECLAACQRLLTSADKDLARSGWYSAEWLRETIAGAPLSFDRACDRWRELYKMAEQQLQEARAATDRKYLTRSLAISEAEQARRRESEALRQKDLLCNTAGNDQQGDTDFYPYRYFASEGFLPGYNFPRLPVQAFLSTNRDSGTFLSRPRFLALSEFGPRNVIYHEGAKYRVTRLLLPAGSADSRLVTAKICRKCGFFHEGQAALTIEMCEHCGQRLEADSSLTTNRLFEMTTVATQRVERITSEEEERMREGFFVTTHFRFAGPHRTLTTRTRPVERPTETLLEMCYAPAATLWRINHRWRRSTSDGFTLDLKKGAWAKKPGDETDSALDVSQEAQLLSGVRLMVRDTRNLLLVQPDQSQAENEDFLASLQFALQRGIEAVFQVEEQELVAERIGEGRERRLLLWEAAEGGVGVLTRLAEEEDGLARVAREALRTCHYNPETGLEDPTQVGDCSHACYRCLLSYSNQHDHALLHRSLVRDILLELSHSRTGPVSNELSQTIIIESGNSNKKAGNAFEEKINGEETASFAQKVLLHLKTSQRRLPDSLNPHIEEVSGSRPQFYYQRGHICVFCDEETPSPGETGLRRELVDYGYRVITLHQNEDLEAQLNRWPDIFKV